MSDVHNTTAPAEAPQVTEPATTDAPAAPTEAIAEAPATTEAATTETANTTTEAAAAAPVVDEAKPEAENAIEPITEGQLGYRGPGLLKSLIPSKKEFWLSDEPVSPQHLDLYLRGEKPEVSHAVVAWASQTGKGLLFFNKKGDSDKTHPADVLALYDATDLKKVAPHEFSFKIGHETHVFKAEDDAKRDGWYLSIEKAIELGKASKDEVRESEGYKAEMEKLNKSNLGVVAAAAAKRTDSKPKKSTDVPAAGDRVGSSDGEVEDDKKHVKSRSTSRGLLNRLKGHKDETEKKEEKADKEEAKTEGEAAPVAATTDAAPAVAAVSAIDTPAATEGAAEEKAAETPAAEEKVKPSKRGSIFGRVSSGWNKIQSPSKEKDHKEAELKQEPAKDAVVSENPPQLPETSTDTGSGAVTAVPAVEEPKAEEKAAEKKDEAATPNKEKSNFLSGIGGFIKRNRSVSPSAQMKEAAKKEDAAPATEQPAAEPAAVKTEEPVTEGAAAVEPSAETPSAEKTEETTPGKRQSVLGSLGRRASKAFKGFQPPKKENSTPAATEAKKEEAAETKPTEETPVVNGDTKKEEPEAQKSIGDVVPDAVNVGQPQHQSSPTVTATA